MAEGLVGGVGEGLRGRGRGEGKKSLGSRCKDRAPENSNPQHCLFGRDC